MITDIQKAGMWKRISAQMLDLILIATVAIALAFALSGFTGYDRYVETWEAAMASTAEEYGVDFEITEDAYSALTDEEKAVYDEAYAALLADGEAVKSYNMANSLSLVITSVGILAAYAIFEFAVPAFMKNGVTIGKKVFGLCVIRTDGVRINNAVLFVRAFLGKYTIEVMVPVLFIIMRFFNTIGNLAFLLLAAMGILQIVLICATRTNSPIHDLLADTVVVDYQSQMIFDSPEARTDYVKKAAAEKSLSEKY